MPRLLLVDDNPSIHRIAESLLAPTDVELVCVDSAAEALDRIARGDRFDVALVDTAMPGMDGWTLLARLRGMEETARLPIALMAGVLDPVDPAKLAQAPVQGFLKKPIELRELGDRVKALLAMPVAPRADLAPFSAPAESEPGPFGSVSPFSTVPATSTRDLARMVEPELPEFRPEAALDIFVPPPEAADDLLVLTAEDLWPEEPAIAPAAPEPVAVAAVEPPAPEVHLELEELDLDSLRGLAEEPPPALPDSGSAGTLPVAEAMAEDAAPEAPTEGAAESDENVAEPIVLADLGDFDALPADLELPPPVAPEAARELEPRLEAGLETGWEVPDVGIAALADLIGTPSPAEEPVPALEPAPVAAVGQLPAASGQAAAPAVPAGSPQALVQALLADPVLVDALVRAVVARMGDQVVREIAWEVMPELAGRLQK